MIVRGRKEAGAARTALAAAVALALVVAACEAPTPTAVRPTGGDPDAPAVQVSPAGSVRALVADATGAQPWVFIDGQRAPEGFPRTLEPADIERIEVVKGGAAARLYGAEASDGVIQVFTKAAAAREAEGGVMRTDTIPAGVLRADTTRRGVRLRRASATGDPAADVTVYVDGVLFEGDPSSIDPETIDRVDVVKNGTTGSVVRIRTKEAARGGGEE